MHYAIAVKRGSNGRRDYERLRYNSGGRRERRAFSEDASPRVMHRMVLMRLVYTLRTMYTLSIERKREREYSYTMQKLLTVCTFLRIDHLSCYRYPLMKTDSFTRCGNCSRTSLFVKLKSVCEINIFIEYLVSYIHRCYFHFTIAAKKYGNTYVYLIDTPCKPYPWFHNWESSQAPTIELTLKLRHFLNYLSSSCAFAVKGIKVRWNLSGAVNVYGPSRSLRWLVISLEISFPLSEFRRQNSKLPSLSPSSSRLASDVVSCDENDGGIPMSQMESHQVGKVGARERMRWGKLRILFQLANWWDGISSEFTTLCTCTINA